MSHEETAGCETSILGLSPASAHKKQEDSGSLDQYLPWLKGHTCTSNGDDCVHYLMDTTVQG